jgi:hypothetical protein
MVLNALYVCLPHSRFVENHPIWILEDGPLIYEVVLSQPPILTLSDLLPSMKLLWLMALNS